MDIEEPLFQPFPSDIVFQNFEPFQIYEVPLQLRNNDKVQCVYVYKVQCVYVYHYEVQCVYMCTRYSVYMCTRYSVYMCTRCSVYMCTMYMFLK